MIWASSLTQGKHLILKWKQNATPITSSAFPVANIDWRVCDSKPFHFHLASPDVLLDSDYSIVEALLYLKLQMYISIQNLNISIARITKSATAFKNLGL